jgi:hypothetical protein
MRYFLTKNIYSFLLDTVIPSLFATCEVAKTFCNQNKNGKPWSPDSRFLGWTDLVCKAHEQSHNSLPLKIPA